MKLGTKILKLELVPEAVIHPMSAILLTYGKISWHPRSLRPAQTEVNGERSVDWFLPAPGFWSERKLISAHQGMYPNMGTVSGKE